MGDPKPCRCFPIGPTEPTTLGAFTDLSRACHAVWRALCAVALFPLLDPLATPEGKAEE